MKPALTPRTLTVHTHTLPAYWASYLINGDSSGITPEDKALADAYLLANALPYPVSCGESEFSWRNDATTLGGDVCEYVFLLPA